MGNKKLGAVVTIKTPNTMHILYTYGSSGALYIFGSHRNAMDLRVNFVLLQLWKHITLTVHNKITVFWDRTQCSLVARYQLSGGNYRLRLPEKLQQFLLRICKIRRRNFQGLQSRYW